MLFYRLLSPLVEGHSFKNEQNYIEPNVVKLCSDYYIGLVFDILSFLYTLKYGSTILSIYTYKCNINTIYILKQNR